MFEKRCQRRGLVVQLRLVEVGMQVEGAEVWILVGR